MRKTIAAALLLILVLTGAACGGDDSAGSGTAAQEAHSANGQIPEELVQEITEAVNRDMEIIMSVKGDSAPLAEAMTDGALEDAQAQHAHDLAVGRYLVREYDNLTVEVTGYTEPTAEVLIELDDNSYYVNSETGAAVDSPTNEHASYILALVEEGGQWKIQGIYSSSPGNSQSAHPGE